MIDPQNVFANTMLGHWLVWTGGPLTAARPYFDAAVSSGKERPFVRTYQLAAARNRSDDAGDAELVRIVNSMRQQNETPDERSARAAYAVFERRYGARPRVPDAAIEISLSDQLATFTWLARIPGVSGRAEVNDVVVATLNKAMQR